MPRFFPGGCLGPRSQQETGAASEQAVLNLGYFSIRGVVSPERRP
jgi:hypothetical protein